MGLFMQSKEEIRMFQYLFGSREIVPLERRVFNAVVFAAAMLTCVLLLEAAFLSYPHDLLLTLIASVVFLSAYTGSRFLKHEVWPLLSYFLTVGVVIIADWFIVGGTSGLSLPILVAISATIPLVSSKKSIILLLGFLVAVFTVLLVLTSMYWNLIPIHLGGLEASLIQIIEAGALSVQLLFVAGLTISSYRHEKMVSQELNESLEKKNSELALALKEIEVLRGMLPCCSYCGRIKPNDVTPRSPESWMPLEDFVSKHSGAQFSHGICPDCVKNHFGQEFYKKLFSGEDTN